MLFGTPNVRDFSLASTNSTAENQRLKLSALICGLSAADNRCQSCAHFLSIADLLTVLHKCHTGWRHGKSPTKTNKRWGYSPAKAGLEKSKKNVKNAKKKG